jgi:SAM-dependent methyltransferase
VNDPTGWFERLYTAAEGGETAVPWDRAAPHRHLVAWAESRWAAGSDGGGGDGDGGGDRPGAGRRALVVGCGTGDDAEYVARFGFDTVAFDVSDAAVRTARRRYPGSPVTYLTADLLEPPASWSRAFDLVVEVQTVQALPDPLRARATSQIGQMVAPGGTLVVVAAAGDQHYVAADGPPWPLVRAEVEAFAAGGLRTVRVERITEPAGPGAGDWLAEFRRPAADG